MMMVHVLFGFENLKWIPNMEFEALDRSYQSEYSRRPTHGSEVINVTIKRR